MGSQVNESSKTVKKQIPVAEGLFYQPTSPEEKPYLIGSKCTCGYVTFLKLICPHCAKKDTLEKFISVGKGNIHDHLVAFAGFKLLCQSYIKLNEGSPSVING
jgi:uncharacterized OB-fold protein